MAQREVLTLDVPELQVLAHYPGDAGGFFWHHRLLLRRLAAGRFVCASPDLEVHVIDLNHQGHVPLGRNSRFPAAQAATVYAFDPLTQAELTQLRREAATWVSLLGEGPEAEEGQFVWVVCDVRDGWFGEEVPDEVVQDPSFTSVGDMGIATWDEEVKFCQRVLKSEVEGKKKQWRPADSDCRILAVRRNDQGRRACSLADHANALTEVAMDDWPHPGPRAYRELVLSVSDSANSWGSYHTEWTKASGISEGTSLVHEHKTLSTAFGLLQSVDQLNGANLAAVEMLARRMIQIEMATERSNKSPDFSGLSVVMASPTTDSGAAVTRNFTEWVSQRQKDRAQVMKQQRIYSEEQAATEKRSKQGKGKGKDKSKGQPEAGAEG